MKTPILYMSGLKVRRDSKLVLDIDEFSLSEGELVSVIGPNGAGKSTMLQAASTILPYCAGTLRLFGQDAAGADTLVLRRRCALLFQEPLFISDTVFNNVALPLRLRGVKGEEVRRKVVRFLTMLKCEHLGDRSAHCLSGGEAQRVNLARALVVEPEMLLLDEPFSSLDTITRKMLLTEFRQIIEDQGIAAVLISHSMDDVLYLSGRAVVLQEGRIIQQGDPEEILRRPVNEGVARLVGADNILPCRITEVSSGAQIELNPQIKFIYTRPLAARASLCCLPGDIFRVIGENEDPPVSQAAIKGIVKRVVPGIGVNQIILEDSGLSFTACLPRDHRATADLLGQTLCLTFDPNDAQII